MIQGSKHLLASYSRHSAKRPMLVASLTGATVAVCGDLLCQKVVEKQKHVNLKRTAAVASYMFLYAGWLRVGWYPLLDFSFKGFAAAPAAGFKTLVDIGFHCPLVHVPTFFVWTSLCRGASWDQTKTQFQDNFVAAATSGLSFWFPAQAITFGLVSPELRIPWVQAASLVWIGILSFKANATPESAGKEACDKVLAIDEQLTLRDISIDNGPEPLSL